MHVFSFNSAEATGILYTMFQEIELKNYEYNLNSIVNHVIFFAVTFNMGVYFLLNWEGGVRGEDFIKI